MKPYSPPPTASLGFGLTSKTKEFKRRKSDDESPVVRKAKILVVDNDPALLRLMVSRLGAANYTVETAVDAQRALDACVRSRPNLVITELRMKEMDGLALLKELKSRWPQLTVIILTAHGTISEAVEATQCGAFGFLVKPVGKEELLGQVQRATVASTFTLVEGDWRANIVSRSQLMEDRLQIANRAAGSAVPVLLTGESGTGKELLARAIHAASERREKPFVAVSCSSTDQDALESELFGDRPEESGDARAPREAALQRARGGTLLLDEIGDLSMKLQVALVRALTKDRLPSGMSWGPDRTDARLICTSSRDLKALTDSGAFLADLYYQINILPIEIPPLGRRREDIPLLVSHFLGQATEPGGQRKIYSPKAIELLVTTDWPGNVRQLFDLVKQNVALAQGKVMTKEFVQQSMGAGPAKLPTYDEARDQFSRDYLTENLQRTAGNVAEAARLAKRSRTYFYKLLAHYRLHAEDFKNADHANHPETDANHPETDAGQDE
jgi:two-component system, NtrC family, response regulator GlrR